MIFPKIKDEKKEPIGLQAMIIPITVFEIFFERAKGGKKGAIIDFERHSRNPQIVRTPKTKFLCILKLNYQNDVF